MLSRNCAFQSDMGGPIYKAGSLAIEINHLPENYGKPDRSVMFDKLECKVIRDVADAWKHKRLRDKRRRNELVVMAQFEVSDDGTQFRFIRNRIVIEHVTYGSLDFLETSATAIQWWLLHSGTKVDWVANSVTQPYEFESSAFLYWDQSCQLELANTRLEFVKDCAGVFVAYDPPDGFEFRLFDMPAN
ncbi:hypothetical protein M6G63_14465 [Pseudomonas sp. BYT-5]|uniref:hypothetical protein n=1 Tax=unclassified Pseudomonas TaxID=196821 RepID=UPI0020205BFE|nr:MULTISPECIES: hypothetical protein [unclassified Pseudomonas]URD40685.1 hypothetical protein M6G63_14465 [Pseudomonas sp. BYT-5]URK96045.1 hypothetical protein J5X93_15155 [Pseudomonas sp. BYT-1]